MWTKVGETELDVDGRPLAQVLSEVRAQFRNIGKQNKVIIGSVLAQLSSIKVIVEMMQKASGGGTPHVDEHRALKFKHEDFGM